MQVVKSRKAVLVEEFGGALVKEGEAARKPKSIDAITAGARRAGTQESADKP